MNIRLLGINETKLVNQSMWTRPLDDIYDAIIESCLDESLE